jgi:YggT family protein
MAILAEIVNRLFQLLSLLVVVQVMLSYFMSPYHKVRLFIDRLVVPMYRPIQRFVPPVQGLDFSPFILIILLQLLGGLLRGIILSAMPPL